MALLLQDWTVFLRTRCFARNFISHGSRTIMINKSLFSSESVEWATPQWLFDALNIEFSFTLDPCCTAENTKVKDNFFTRQEDGLSQDWGTHSVFMNPPYGKEISQWMEKAFHSSLNGATVVALVPARTDTKWWHDLSMKGEIRLLRGRIKFVGGKHSAPFPSAVVIFRPPHYKLGTFSQ